MTHTPGPWSLTTANADTYKGLDCGVKGPEIDGALDFTICDMCDDGYDNETQKANAHLIAAAPDLLEALEVVRNSIETTGQFMGSLMHSQIISAIKKAKGL